MKALSYQRMQIKKPRGMSIAVLTNGLKLLAKEVIFVSVKLII